MCDGNTYMHLIRSLDETLSKEERDSHKKLYKKGKMWWLKKEMKYARKYKLALKYAGTKYRSLVFAYNFLNKKTFCERNIKQDIMSYIKGEREALALPVIKRAIALSYARTLTYKIWMVKDIQKDFNDEIQFEPNAERHITEHNKICDLAFKTHKKALKNIPSNLLYKPRKCDKDSKSRDYRPLGWYSYCPPSWNDNAKYKDRETMVCEGVDELWSCMLSFRDDYQLETVLGPPKKGEWSRRKKDHTKESIRIG